MENQPNNTTDAKADRNGGGSGRSPKMAHDKESDSSSSDTGHHAGNASGEVMDKLKVTAGSLVDKAKVSAGDAYGAVAEKASSVINEHKSEFSVGLTGVADTVRRVSGAITEGDTKNAVTEYAAQYSETAAEKLEGVAQYFETTDLKGMARDVESYGRRNPAIFLGAAFAIGVLAARFIKSSPSPKPLKAGAKKELSADGNGHAAGQGASAGAI
ncbi:MAG: hypothetical protein ABIP78_08705 [Pyrinomonadaceae bacterium]